VKGRHIEVVYKDKTFVTKLERVPCAGERVFTKGWAGCPSELEVTHVTHYPLPPEVAPENHVWASVKVARERRI